MTEARVWTLAIAVGIMLAIACVATHQWLGVVAALIATLNAWAARYFLVRWKPSALVE